MAKLLVNNPQGRQEIITVREGGGYFDNSRVLWDERIHGPMPEVTLDVMVSEDVKEPMLDSNGKEVLDAKGQPIFKTVRHLFIDKTLMQYALDLAVQDAFQEELQTVWAERLKRYAPLGDWEDARWKAEFLGDRSELDRLNKEKAEIKAMFPKPKPPSLMSS